jgi:hypothetical protein
MRHRGDKLVLPGNVQVDRRGDQHPRHQPQPRHAHPQAGQQQVERGEDGDADVHAERDRPSKITEGRLDCVGHGAEAVDRPDDAEQPDQDDHRPRSGSLDPAQGTLTLGAGHLRARRGGRAVLVHRDGVHRCTSRSHSSR